LTSKNKFSNKGDFGVSNVARPLPAKFCSRTLKFWPLWNADQHVHANKWQWIQNQHKCGFITISGSIWFLQSPATNLSPYCWTPCTTIPFRRSRKIANLLGHMTWKRKWLMHLNYGITKRHEGTCWLYAGVERRGTCTTIMITMKTNLILFTSIPRMIWV
jgi:hypothetical protein